MIKKGLFRLGLIALSAFTLCIPTAYAGDEWQKIFQDLSLDKEITPGKLMSASLYNTKMEFTITDNNNFASDFNDNDTVFFRITGNGENLYPTKSLTKDELVTWAEDNKDKLFKAIFGNAPDASIGGMTGNQALAQQLFTSINSSPENNGTSFIPISTKDIILNSQYDFMEINNNDATGNSGMLSYAFTLGENKDYSIGITVPYRQLELDDNLDSQYKHLSAVPNVKKRWYLEQSMVELTVNALFGLTYLESSLFPDGGGYLDYGAGTAVKYAYAFNDQLSLNAGLGYMFSKREIPSDLVPDEIKWVSDALNSVDMEHDIIPSVGVFYSIIPGKLSLRGELFRISQLQSDAISDYKNQTVAMGAVTYNVFRTTKVSLGYKRSFELKDVTDQSFILDLKIGW